MTPAVRLGPPALCLLKHGGQAADAAVGAAAHRAGPLDVVHGSVQAGELGDAPPDGGRVVPRTAASVAAAERALPIATVLCSIIRVAGPGVQILTAVGLRAPDGSFRSPAAGRQQPRFELGGQNLRYAGFGSG